MILLLLITNKCLYSQDINRTFADTAFVYKGFGSGGTTSNLVFYSKAVDSISNVQKVQLNAQSLDTLNFLLYNVKPRRHFQQKIGPGFYASIISKGTKRQIAIVPGWAIIDLKNKKQYVFRNTTYSEMYNRFVIQNFR